MELTEKQLKWLGSQLGDEPVAADLQTAYDRLGSVRDVALETLRKRRAQWLSQPMSVNVSGVASLSYAENVKAIERQIAELVRMDDDPSDNAGGGDVEAAGDDYLEIIPFTRNRRR